MRPEVVPEPVGPGLPGAIRHRAHQRAHIGCEPPIQLDVERSGRPSPSTVRRQSRSCSPMISTSSGREIAELGSRSPNESPPASSRSRSAMSAYPPSAFGFADRWTAPLPRATARGRSSGRAGPRPRGFLASGSHARTLKAGGPAVPVVVGGAIRLDRDDAGPATLGAGDPRSSPRSTESPGPTTILPRGEPMARRQARKLPVVRGEEPCQAFAPDLLDLGAEGSRDRTRQVGGGFPVAEEPATPVKPVNEPSVDDAGNPASGK